VPRRAIASTASRTSSCRAALVGASLTRASCPELAERIERMLADRPLAVEAPALTALTNRLVAYLEGG
jgi:hypothetical protein